MFVESSVKFPFPLGYAQIETIATDAFLIIEGVVDDVAVGIAKTPVGRSGNVLEILTKNKPTTINGTKFTGHALDQMQARGILTPSTVLDVIKNPVIRAVGNTPGTKVFIRDNLKVITNLSGDVITVIPN